MIPGGQKIEARGTVIWAKSKVSLNWSGDSENGEEGMTGESPKGVLKMHIIA